MRTIWKRSVLRRLLCGLVTAGLIFVFGIAVASASPQDTRAVHDSGAHARLLSREEGRAIVRTAGQAELSADGPRDCSHLVHQIYADAGFDYPYVSSLDIYAAADENFVRVKTARAGDVVTWRGHAGIVVDPHEHSFYSLVRTGLETQDYESAYWRSRGRPRFYRLRIGNGAVMSPAKHSVSSKMKNPVSEK